MIEIKQEQEAFYPIELERGPNYISILTRILNHGQDDATFIHHDNLPTLISHLIEMGGVDRGTEALWDDDAPASGLLEHIKNNYHLVPKKKI